MLPSRAPSAHSFASSRLGFSLTGNFEARSPMPDLIGYLLSARVCAWNFRLLGNDIHDGVVFS